MKIRTLQLAAANVRNLVAQKLYLKTGIDFTRPVQIYGLINIRCNAKCRMCNCWRSADPVELPASTWIRCLGQLKKLSGTFNINFSGGEPLIKRDLFEILRYCQEQRIIAGITTNGLLLNDKNIQQLLECQIYNINVSLDSMIDEIHDSIRGVPGCLKRVTRNVENLLREKEKTGSKVSVLIKPMVCAENLRDIHKIAEYAKDIGASGVSYQPIFEWSEESKEMSSIDPSLLREVVDRLIKMKKDGYPILNPEPTIAQWPDYFSGKLPGPTSPCVVALRSLSIRSNGDVLLCTDHNAIIGNMAQGNIRDLWFSEKARKTRAELVKCRKLCLRTCLIKRSFKDYVAIFKKLTR